MMGRLWWARWQRVRRWEFWPVWMVYPPVLLSVLWHGLRLRGLTLWANCNPAMAASGMAMEEKGAILDSFAGAAGRIRVAGYFRVAGGGREVFSRVLGEMRERGFDFPVVLKPDIGQRGQGVEIVRDKVAARRWVEHCREGFLVQEYAGGLEFGIHWAKFAGAEEGAITSLCRKHPQGVTGDGKRTLKELILADDRAVLMSRYYFQKYAGELEKVPAEGEQLTLAPIGTHARGAVFTDERSLVTEALREAFDELGARYPGFHFGRYDVKAPSVVDLQAGRGIVVLELNGVMGEPAHIYQPGYPWWRGMRDLCRHFRLAAEIGRDFRDRGVRPPELGELVELIRQHREKIYLEVDEFKRRN